MPKTRELFKFEVEMGRLENILGSDKRSTVILQHKLPYFMLNMLSLY